MVPINIQGKFKMKKYSPKIRGLVRVGTCVMEITPILSFAGNPGRQHTHKLIGGHRVLATQDI